jgi:hypothetical protein
MRDCESMRDCVVDDSQRNGVGEATGPGYFNDLDFLQIGYKALSDEKSGGQPLMTDDEYRSEFSVFCLLAAPLIMSNDLSKWTPAMADTLLNPEMIAIDQDPMAIAGKLVWNSSEGCVGDMCAHPYAGMTVDPQNCNGCQLNVNPNVYTVYARPLHDGSVAIGLLNRVRPPPPPAATTPKGSQDISQGQTLRRRRRDSWKRYRKHARRLLWQLQSYGRVRVFRLWRQFMVHSVQILHAEEHVRPKLHSVQNAFGCSVRDIKTDDCGQPKCHAHDITRPVARRCAEG